MGWWRSDYLSRLLFRYTKNVSRIKQYFSGETVIKKQTNVIGKIKYYDPSSQQYIIEFQDGTITKESCSDFIPTPELENIIKNGHDNNNISLTLPEVKRDWKKDNEKIVRFSENNDIESGVSESYENNESLKKGNQESDTSKIYEEPYEEPYEDPYEDPYEKFFGNNESLKKDNERKQDEEKQDEEKQDKIKYDEGKE